MPLKMQSLQCQEMKIEEIFLCENYGQTLPRWP